MMSDADYREAVRRDKNMQADGHERQRCPALILRYRGYRYREIAAIVLGEEGLIRRWVKPYQEKGLAGVQNDPNWGGEHGQRELSPEEREELKHLLREEAMPGTQVGSGGTNKAVRQLIAERFQGKYSPSGMRKVFAQLGWSYQRGRKLSHRRTPEEQARYERETRAVLAKYARTGQKVVPLASDQSKVSLESKWPPAPRAGWRPVQTSGQSLWCGASRYGRRSGPVCDRLAG